MEFVNALINGTKDLEKRNDTRENFLKMGLLDLLYQLRSLQSTELDKQLDIFSQQMEEDKSALMYVFDLASARIPSSGFVPIHSLNDMWYTTVYIEEAEQPDSDGNCHPMKIEFDLKKSCSEAITAVIQRLAKEMQDPSKEKEWYEEWGLCWVSLQNSSSETTVWLEPTESLESYRLNLNQVWPLEPKFLVLR